jgi:PAS domain S-box-containing protein
VHCSTAILVFDCETLRIVDVNDAAVSAYGYAREEFLELTIEDIRPPEDLARLHECLANRGKGYPGGKISRHRKRDGTLMEAQIFGLMVQFAGRRARLAMIQDVSHQRRLEEQLRHSQKLEAAGLLAGGIAHDFNNLLSIVLGSSELARRAVGAGRSPAEQLESTSSAASRAAELTRKLLGRSS